MRLNSLKHGNVTYDISHRSWHIASFTCQSGKLSFNVVLSAFLELYP